MPRLAVVLLVIPAVAWPAPALKTPPAESPVGRWSFDGYTMDGVRYGDRGGVITLTPDGRFETHVGERMVSRGTYTHDAGKVPKEIELTTDNPAVPMARAIYRFDGGTMHMYQFADGKRPRSFEAESDAGRIRSTYKRVKATD